MRALLSILLWCIWFIASAQLTIDDCYQKAQANYPLIKQYGLIERSRDFNLSNATKGHLPQVTFSAKASYQSDVTQIPISLPGIDIKGLNRDQYGATIDVSQTVWDGGAVRSRQEMIRALAEVDKESIDVELYNLNNRVNQLFFCILLFDAQLAQNRLFREELQRNYNRVQSGIENGVANQTDLDVVRAEQLKAIQQESQLVYQRRAFHDMLSALIGEELGENTTLVKPEAASFIHPTIQRPELSLFEAKIRNLEAQNAEIKAGLMPKLGVFATGGYGNPGLNMLKNGFSSYYIIGARLTWNIAHFYTHNNAKQLIQSNIQSIRTQQETFLFNTNLDVSQRRHEIEKFREQMQYDDEIIALRTSIKQASEVKLENGLITVNDLMRDVYAEESAKQTKIQHEIEWLLAVYNLKFSNGH